MKQMCRFKCMQIHSEHRIFAVEGLDYNSPELQADERINNELEQLQAKVKALRGQINESLDTLEESIERIKSKSLKEIIDPLVSNSVEATTATVNALRHAILKNITWNSDKNMQLRRRETAEIFNEISSELNKVRDEFLNGIGLVSTQVQKQQLISKDVYEKNIKSSDDLEIVLNEMSKFNNLVEIKLDLNNSRLTENEVIKLLNSVKTHKNIINFRFKLRYILTYN